MADVRFEGCGAIIGRAIPAPLPATMVGNQACFIVKDATGQALAYFYFEEEPGRRSATQLRAMIIKFSQWLRCKKGLGRGLGILHSG